MANGIIPESSDLDAAGFFAEHHNPVPPPNCGDRVCVHGMLGYMGNMVDGAPCTVLQLGLNSPISIDADDRPPLTLVVVVDVSGSMRERGKLDFVRAGLRRLANELQDGDRLGLVTYDDRATVVFEAQEVGGRRNELDSAVSRLQPGGRTNLYAGLETGFEVLERAFDDTRSQRVVLLSDGIPTAGKQSEAEILAMSRDHNARGIGLTTIGLGNDFNVALMRGLAEQGDGNFYFVEDVGAVEEVFAEEVSFFSVPVAYDVRVDVSEGADFVLGEAYGSALWQSRRGGGSLSLPSVFVAHRESHRDVTESGGRRGGGGALILELMPNPEAPERAESDVAEIRLSYLDPTTDEQVVRTVDVMYPGDANRVPARAFFSGPTVTKSFVMLNILVGLQTACDRFHELRDARGAVQLLNRLMAAARDYNDEVRDEGIRADIELMQSLADLLARNGGRGAADDGREDPWPAD